MADETTIKRISSGLAARFEADGDVSADSVGASNRWQAWTAARGSRPAGGD